MQYLSYRMFKQLKWPVYWSLLFECFEEPLNRIEPTSHNHALGSNTLRCSDPNDFCHSQWRRLLSFTESKNGDYLHYIALHNHQFVDEILSRKEGDVNILFS